GRIGLGEMTGHSVMPDESVCSPLLLWQKPQCSTGRSDELRSEAGASAAKAARCVAEQSHKGSVWVSRVERPPICRVCRALNGAAIFRSTLNTLTSFVKTT